MSNRSGPLDTGHQNTSKSDNSKGQEKWRRILKLLTSGAKLTRFDVERFGDHCFNTSVSVIGKKGIRISREPVVIEGRFGAFRCKRYWLEADEIARAIRLLEAQT